MPRISWDAPGERYYEAGIDRGVLYTAGEDGVPWNGLISVQEDPSGGEPRPFYIDGTKYLNLPGAEEYRGTLEAFTYPREFLPCDGVSSIYFGLHFTAQRRASFGLCYRTWVGNDTQGQTAYYKLHILYNLLAQPSGRSQKTLGDNTDTANFSWSLSSLAPANGVAQRTAHIVVDTRYADPMVVSALEDILYGAAEAAARLPLPDEIVTIFEVNSSFRVVDHGDGSWTASGTDEEVHWLDATSFEITTPGAEWIDGDSYTLTSP